MEDLGAAGPTAAHPARPPAAGAARAKEPGSQGAGGAGPDDCSVCKQQQGMAARRVGTACSVAGPKGTWLTAPQLRWPDICSVASPVPLRPPFLFLCKGGRDMAIAQAYRSRDQVTHALHGRGRGWGSSQTGDLTQAPRPQDTHGHTKARSRDTTDPCHCSWAPEFRIEAWRE